MVGWVEACCYDCYSCTCSICSRFGFKGAHGVVEFKIRRYLRLLRLLRLLSTTFLVFWIQHLLVFWIQMPTSVPQSCGFFLLLHHLLVTLCLATDFALDVDLIHMTYDQTMFGREQRQLVD